MQGVYANQFPASFAPRQKMREEAKKKTLGGQRSLTFLILVLLISFAALASYIVFSKQSLRLDESQSMWQSSHNPGAVMHFIAEDVHVPFYPLLLHYWMVFFGNSVATARLLSLLFFLPSIPAIYFLGRKIYGPSMGLLAAILLAVSPFINWYGNEIRMYSLLTLVTIVNLYFFISLFHSQKALFRKRQLTGFWIGYFLTALVGVFTHYFFWMVILTQGIFFLFYKDLFPKHSLRNLFVIAGLLLLSYAPWILYVINLNMFNNSSPILPKPTTINLFNTFSQFIFGFQDDHLNTLIVSLWPLSVLFAFLSLRKNNRPNPATVYLFLTAILPIVMAFIISIVFKPLFITRYLILCIPALYLFLAKSISVYPKKLSTALKVVVIAGMILTLGKEAYSANTPAKENYQQASQYLTGHAKPQDIIAVSAPFTIYPVEYYYKGPAAITTIPYWDRYVVGPIPVFSQETLIKQVNELQPSHEILWLLLSYDQGYESSLKLYFDTHFQKVEEKNFSKDLNLYAYKLKYTNLTFDEILNNYYKEATTTQTSIQ